MATDRHPLVVILIGAQIPGPPSNDEIHVQLVQMRVGLTLIPERAKFSEGLMAKEVDYQINDK